LKANMVRLEAKVDTGFHAARKELHEVRDDLRQHMDVLFEELRADIKAIPDHTAYIDGQIGAGLNAIRDEFEPRLRNVELAVKKRKRG
jgi:hypothetical protein